MSNEKSMSLVGHLEELRRVIIVSVISIIGFTIVIYGVFREHLLQFLLMPMEQMDIPLIYISMTEGFITQIKASFFAALIISLPIILWQLWSFILPALYQNEKKYLTLVVPGSFFLFILGVAFAYYMVFPLAVAFLIGISGEGLSPMISIGKYLSFLISFSLPFGIVFQLPLVILLLTKLGIVNAEFLSKNRKYALFAIVVISAMLTPPDAISLTLMAAPMLVLYEISIIFSKIFSKKTENESEDIGQ
ncbi:MAG: twin-arginine translocase subunit TatC [Bacillota bacterium]|nr:twin-arginine translocase subunit TatC [Bacillota bacterium]